jgi:hypothetical protein
MNLPENRKDCSREELFEYLEFLEKDNRKLHLQIETHDEKVRNVNLVFERTAEQIKSFIQQWGYPALSSEVYELIRTSSEKTYGRLERLLLGFKPRIIHPGNHTIDINSHTFFRPERLVLGKERDHFLIQDIRIGNCSLLCSSESVPGSMFTSDFPASLASKIFQEKLKEKVDQRITRAQETVEKWLRQTEFRSYRMNPAQQLLIYVYNKSNEPKELDGGFWGLMLNNPL